MALPAYEALLKATVSQQGLQDAVRAHATMLASQQQPTSSTGEPHSSPSQPQNGPAQG